MMNLIQIASLFMAVGVMLGAFGAHGLKGKVDDYYIGVFNTGVLYHLIHGLGLFVLAWVQQQFPAVKVGLSAGLMIAGIVLFSGSLYVLVLTQQKWLGAVTPLGGLCFIAAWILLAFSKLHN